jgi:SAM-dependent methyltransferase
MDNDVGLTRWQKALNWEKDFWDHYVSSQRSIEKLAFLKTIAKKILRDGPGDADNYWWAKQFDNYSFVPMQLRDVVEFGCGPFTNLRVILKNRKAQHVFASDPLASHYLTYKGYQLAKKWRDREWLIDDHSLEEMPFADSYFDLVVCINVLDHVRDVNLCMRNLIKVVSRNGILVLGQDLTTEADVQATQDQREKTGATIGHPHIFPSEKFFFPYLQTFQPIIQKVLTKEQGRTPLYHSGTFLFAGQRAGFD